MAIEPVLQQGVIRKNREISVIFFAGAACGTIVASVTEAAVRSRGCSEYRL
jgi:hypothetical protein